MYIKIIVFTKLYQNGSMCLVKKLKQARLEAGLNQQDVATKLKITQSFFSKIEAGQVKLDVFQVKALAKLYKKKFEWFMA